MTEEEFLVEANLFIFNKYKKPSIASVEYGFTNSYLTRALRGIGRLPSKLLKDMGYTETRTVVFTYEKVK